MKNSVLCKLLTVICILCMSFAICSCDGEKPEAPEHTHSFVEGKCECGVLDPNYKPESDNTNPGEPEKNTVTYTVTVVDENNAPVLGAAVQLCVGDICKLPCPTDANGVAIFEDFDPADYAVKINVSGYTGEAEYHFDANATELTVTLTKNAD